MGEGKYGTMGKQKNVWTVCNRSAAGDKDIWNYMIKTDLEAETEVMLFVAQEQAIRTNCVKHKIAKTLEVPLCIMCDNKSGAISYIVSECDIVSVMQPEKK